MRLEIDEVSTACDSEWVISYGPKRLRYSSEVSTTCGSGRLICYGPKRRRYSSEVSTTCGSGWVISYGPKRLRYSSDTRNALTISAAMKSPLKAFSLLSQKL